MQTNTVIKEVRPHGLYALFHPIKYLFLACLFLIAAFFIKGHVPEDIVKYASVTAVCLMLLIYILNFLYIKSIVYTITDEQILYKRGVFTITTDYIELYRVQDFKIVRTFMLRFIGGMNYTMETMDKSHPIFELQGIPKSDIDTIIRNLVEENRARKNVFVTE